MKILPTKNKALLKVKKVYKKEKGKPITDSEGNKLYDLNDFYIEESAIEGIKKGKKVFPIIRGGVPIKELETDTYYYLVVDEEDIYGVQA